MLTDLVLKNRSYRGYNKSRKVTKEELIGTGGHFKTLSFFGQYSASLLLSRMGTG